MKKDAAEIEHGGALFDELKPLQYRMIAGGTCPNFGFYAQDVKAALEKLGIPETAMLSDALNEDDYMGLNHQEFIALTVHKAKCMEARYDARPDALEQRVAALEGGAR